MPLGWRTLYNSGNRVQHVESIVEAVSAWQERPFVYGESDCCQFVSFVYKQSGDHNFMPHSYHGRREAELLLAQYGSLSSAVSSVLDRCHVRCDWLREGDLALCIDNNVETLGIVMSSKVIVTIRGSDGKINFLPWNSTVCGWRID